VWLSAGVILLAGNLAGRSVAAASAVQIVAPGACPEAGAVEVRLRGLLPPSADTAPEIVRVEQEPDGIRVTLGSDQREQRWLPGAPNCQQRAAAAALAIVTWIETTHPEFLSPLPAPPLPRGPAAATLTAVATPPERPSRMAFDVGAGAGANLSGALGPAVVVRVAVTPRGRGLGVSSTASWEAARALALGGGRARWSRATALLGVHDRRSRAGWLGELSAGVGAAYIDLRGVGFDQNYRSPGLSAALVAAARVFLSHPRDGTGAATWLELAAAAWPTKLRAIESATAREGTVPWLSASLMLGLSVGRFGEGR
jgi:hypothetical protein